MSKTQPDPPSLSEIAGLVGGKIDLDGNVLRDADLGGDPCTIFPSRWGGYRVVPMAGAKRSRRELQTFLEVYLNLPRQDFGAANDNGAPVDVFARAASPKLPPDLLPDTISSFADIMGDQMGVDPGGLAMAALAVCAAAIPDAIQIQPKQHDPHWLESTRIWVALVGQPSTKKTPTISVAVHPLRAIDMEMRRSYLDAKEKYDALEKKERESTPQPKHERIMLGDATVEAAADVMKDSPDGVLLLQDELSGWFGSMEKYSGSSRGAQKDKAFWLQAFNGGHYSVDRVGRGSIHVPNLSASLLSGIQPDPMRRVAKEAQDDGLIQRLLPVVLRPSRLGKDVPQPDVASKYARLVSRLNRMRKPLRGGMAEVPVRFSSRAQEVWQDVTSRNFELAASWEAVNTKLAAHVGKYDGLYARLCLLWHCIESNGEQPATEVSLDVAERVRDFLSDYLYPHAVAFYTDVLGLSDRNDELLATAGWILTHKPLTVTPRSVMRGDSTMRKLDRKGAEAVLQQLDAFGWLDAVTILGRERGEWTVRQAVYELFADRAEEEADRRADIRELIASNVRLRSAA